MGYCDSRLRRSEFAHLSIVSAAALLLDLLAIPARAFCDQVDAAGSSIVSESITYNSLD